MFQVLFNFEILRFCIQLWEYSFGLLPSSLVRSEKEPGGWQARKLGDTLAGIAGRGEGYLKPQAELQAPGPELPRCRGQGGQRW